VALVAFVWGVVHAAGPGHGKLIVILGLHLAAAAVTGGHAHHHAGRGEGRAGLLDPAVSGACLAGCLVRAFPILVIESDGLVGRPHGHRSQCRP